MQKRTTQQPWQLFETESREIDQLVSKSLEVGGSSRLFRKPPHLKHRRLPLAVEPAAADTGIESNTSQTLRLSPPLPADGSSGGCALTDVPQKNMVPGSRPATVPGSEEGCGMWTEGLDPSSVSVDALCAFSSHRLKTLKLKRPAWLHNRSLKTGTCTVSHTPNVGQSADGTAVPRPSDSRTTDCAGSPVQLCTRLNGENVIVQSIDCDNDMQPCSDSFCDNMTMQDTGTHDSCRQPNSSSLGGSLTVQNVDTSDNVVTVQNVDMNDCVVEPGSRNAGDSTTVEISDTGVPPYSGGTSDGMTTQTVDSEVKRYSSSCIPSVTDQSSSSGVAQCEPAETSTNMRTIKSRIKTWNMSEESTSTLPTPTSTHSRETRSKRVTPDVTQTETISCDSTKSSVRDSDFIPRRGERRKCCVSLVRVDLPNLRASACEDKSTHDAVAGGAAAVVSPVATAEPASCSQESGPSNSILTRSKLKQQETSTTPPESTQAAATATTSGPGHRPSPVPGRSSAPGRLRRRRRNVAPRKTTMLCVSCKHGFLSSECLLCLSMKTAAKRLVHKASTFKPAGKPSSSRQHGQGKAAPASPVQKTAVRAVKNNNGKIGKDAVKIVVQGKIESRSVVDKKISSPKESKNSVKSSTAKIQPTTGNGLTRNKKHQQVISGKKRTHAASKNKDASRLKTNASPKLKNKPPLKKAKLSPKLDISTVNNGKIPQSKKKLLKSYPKSESYSTEAQILEHHKRLSEQTCSDGGNRFMSTKDMFSQLCQLEEHAKDYDTSVLQEIMPLNEASGEHLFSKPKLVAYPSSLPSSHVGGIWKSIFTDR